MFMLQRRPAPGSETDGCKGVGQLYRQCAQQPSPSLGLVLLSIKKYFDFKVKFVLLNAFINLNNVGVVVCLRVRSVSYSVFVEESVYAATG